MTIVTFAGKWHAINQSEVEVERVEEIQSDHNNIILSTCNSDETASSWCPPSEITATSIVTGHDLIALVSWLMYYSQLVFLQGMIFFRYNSK